MIRGNRSIMILLVMCAVARQGYAYPFVVSDGKVLFDGQRTEGVLMQLVQKQLDSSSSLLQSYSALLRAEQQYSRYQRHLIPNVSVGLSRSKPLRITEDGIQSFDFGFDLAFLEFHGFTMGISIPFSVDMEENGKISEGTVAITIANRNLFNDYTAEEKEALAGYLDAIFAHTQTRFQIFLDTVRQVFQNDYLRKMLEIAHQRLTVYENQRDAESDASRRLELEKRVLNQKRQVLQLEQQVASLLPLELPAQLALEAEVLIGQMIQDMHESEVWESRLDLMAQRLRVEAEQYRQNTWYYPYIPDVGVNLSLKPFDGFAWSIQVEASFDIHRPEKHLEAKNRLDPIQALRYEELWLRLKNGYTKETADIARAELDMRIMQMDYDAKMLDFAIQKDLWERGFIRETDWQLAQLDADSIQAEYNQARRNLLLEKLDLFPYHGYASAIEILDFPVTQREP